MTFQEDTVSPSTGGWIRTSGYHRIRNGVKALIIGTDQALLIRERHTDGSIFWTLPGGGLWSREEPADGLRREIAEELRCRSHVGKPIGTFWYPHQHKPVLTKYEVFNCSLLSRPTPATEEGVLECRWVAPDSFPSTTLPQVERLIDERLGP